MSREAKYEVDATGVASKCFPFSFVELSAERITLKKRTSISELNQAADDPQRKRVPFRTSGTLQGDTVQEEKDRLVPPIVNSAQAL